jgi:hypothetical protein
MGAKRHRPLVWQSHAVFLREGQELGNAVPGIALRVDNRLESVVGPTV